MATSCGENHCVTRSPLGVAFAWAVTQAGNRFGQLGNGQWSRKLDADTLGAQCRVLLPEGIKVAVVAAGGGKGAGHSAAVDEHGGVWCWGCDRWQQLGLAKASSGAVGYTWEDGKIWRTTPMKVTSLSARRIVDVACGGDHTIALSEEGLVWGWGRGHLGQLSGGSSGPWVLAPSVIPKLSSGDGHDVKSVAAAGDCSCVTVRRSDGELEQRCVGHCTEAALKQMGMQMRKAMHQK